MDTDSAQGQLWGALLPVVLLNCGNKLRLRISHLSICVFLVEYSRKVWTNTIWYFVPFSLSSFSLQCMELEICSPSTNHMSNVERDTVPSSQPCACQSCMRWDCGKFLLFPNSLFVLPSLVYFSLKELPCCNSLEDCMLYCGGLKVVRFLSGYVCPACLVCTLLHHGCACQCSINVLDFLALEHRTGPAKGPTGTAQVFTQ